MTQTVIDHAPADTGRVAFSAKLFQLSRPDSVEGEAIATVRNFLVGQHIRDGRRSLAICGATQGVGCTFVSANLSIALAQAGINTLLIDGNMRSPGIADMITPLEPVPGLTDFLASDDNEPPHVMGQVLPNLSILYAGTPRVNAPELLSSNRLKQLLDSSVRTFDMTIVDCPPAANYSDARRIASLLRHALVVVRRDFSYAADVKTLVSELKSDRVNVAGTLLNAVG
ncbi:MAG: CpsD/CapB family tyrosine-protein kinase [Sphingopyxis sp.]